MNKPKSKIAIISQSLGGGGAERFAGLLSVMLDGLGYEIHHVIIENAVDYEYKGRLFNLAEATKGKSGLAMKFAKALAMRRYLKQEEIGVIIDNRPRNSFIRDWVSKAIFGKRKTYYIIHSFNLKTYLPESVFLARMLYRDAEKMICVSKAIEEKVKAIYGFKNTVTIYNPVDLAGISDSEPKELPENYMLFFGRLEEKVKNFTLMLEAFSLSEAYKKISLVILGDGPDKDLILKNIAESRLENHVRILPFRKNPYGLAKNARFSILTSHYEGFPMSVIESLALGTPVVSVDCLSGPSEIIKNGYNGMLVPNHNVKALAEAFSKFAEAGNLYDICKSNATESVAHLSITAISKQWKQILP